ncbi:hypothetical protein [Clostridium fessum]|jgi:hypothetical protein
MSELRMFLRIAGARSAEQFGIRGVKSFCPQHHMHIIISKLHQKSTMTSKFSLPDVCFFDVILMVEWNFTNQWNGSTE